MSYPDNKETWNRVETDDLIPPEHKNNISIFLEQLQDTLGLGLKLGFQTLKLLLDYLKSKADIVDDKVNKAGDTMSGQLTVLSHVYIEGALELTKGNSNVKLFSGVTEGENPKLIIYGYGGEEGLKSGTIKINSDGGWLDIEGEIGVRFLNSPIIKFLSPVSLFADTIISDTQTISFGTSKDYSIVYNPASGGILEFLEGSTIGANVRMVIKNSNIGIGTSSPTEKLDIVGNLKITGTVDSRNISEDLVKIEGDTMSGDLEITDTLKGIILTSPNNTRYRIKVSDTGTLTTEEVVA